MLHPLSCNSALLFDLKKCLKSLDRPPVATVRSDRPRVILGCRAQPTAKTLSRPFSGALLTNVIQVVRGRKVETSEGWRRESKPSGCPHQREPKKKKSGSKTTGCFTEWGKKNGADKCTTALPPPRVQRSCASPAGWWTGPRAKGGGGGRGGEDTREKKSGTAQSQTSSCSGRARLTGGGMFLLFSGRRASLVPNVRAGGPVQGTL